MPENFTKQSSKSVRDKRRSVEVEAPTVARLTYSRAETAEALGIDIQTVDAWIAAETLRASKPGEGRHSRVLIRASSLLAMLDATDVAAPAVRRGLIPKPS